MFIEKYAPEKLSEVILNDNIRKILQLFLDKNTINHILLAGNAGIGKSTLAKVLANELKAEVLYINAGYDNGIDTVRNKIKKFCSSVSINLKIIILDEADSLTPSAQAALRNIIEESQDDTRFILTCNYIGKIIPPIQSRCTPINLKFSQKDVLKRVVQILKKEKIKFTKQELISFKHNILDKKFPDIRSILNNLEQCIQNNELKTDIRKIDNSVLDELITIIIDESNLLNIRQLYMNASDVFNNDYELLSSRLADIYFKDGQWDKGLILTDSLKIIPSVVDKEIQFFSSIIKIKRII